MPRPQPKSRFGCCSVVFFGALVLFGIGLMVPKPKPGQQAPPAATEPKDFDVYSPIEEIVCAIDPAFLDSSALVSPATFVRVGPDTELVKVGAGGLFSGKMYWELSAGGRTKIYVYRHVFDQRFRLVRTVKQ